VDRKVADLVDYYDTEVSKYVGSLVGIVRKEAEGAKVEGGSSDPVVTLWEGVRTILLKMFCKEDLEQQGDVRILAWTLGGQVFPCRSGGCGTLHL
jgi:hypothetical protein